MDLQIHEHGDGYLTVRLPVDSLDATNARAFRREMTPLVRANSKIILDMRNIVFVDSSGLGSLITCLRKLGNGDGAMRLFGLNHTVQSMFELMRMHRVFVLCDDEAQALRSLQDLQGNTDKAEALEQRNG
jgi:anti-sigma B factor antagonist